MNVHMARNQKGFTLTEALIAFVITASGLLAVASFQAELTSESAHSKARTEALSLAQQKIEQFRHYTHANEDNFIDDNADGIMDADGTYAEDPIVGQNAEFTRSWTLATTGRTRQIEVTVSWVDRANQPQSIMLPTEMAWISPRAGADQLAQLSPPFVSSPTGRAEIGDGELADYPAEDITHVSSSGPNGLSLYQHKEDLLLVDANDKILLTLLEACSTTDGTCKDFVTISGTVYVDTANTSQQPADIHVIAADAAHCERWVPTGTLTSPPSTSGGDYLYYNYTCYVGGGWHGNIGFVTASGLQQRDKVCQGDPTALDAWEQPVIALRRAYRGMIRKGPADDPVYLTQGIKDAVSLTGQDFVFTELAPDKTQGAYCVGADSPMTRGDSSGGMLFQDVPTDFVCLNTDDDGDSIPDYLDNYDTTEYAADLTCPFDPTDPPVLSHRIVGHVYIETVDSIDLSDFEVNTSDGPGNCRFDDFFTSTIYGYEVAYSCNVYDWGSGWTGHIEIKPNSNFIYCPTRTADFSSVTSDQSHDFQCAGVPTVTIQGAIFMGSGTSGVSSMLVAELGTGLQGTCEIKDGLSYSCLAPYTGEGWDGTIVVVTSGFVCEADANTLTFLDLTAEISPYTYNVTVENNSSKCP